MVDYILVGLLGAFALRGWLRGFVREVLDVATLIVGAVLAFRLASPLGSIVSEATGLAAEPARMVSGGVAFLAISVAAAVAAHFIHRAIRILPGLTLLNRVGGAAIGGVYALLLGVLALTLLEVLPTSEAIDAALGESTVAARLTDPTGPVQRGVALIAGDRVMQTLMVIDGLVGDQTVAFVATDAEVRLPPVAGSLLRPSTGAATDLFDMTNAVRSEAGVARLAWDDALALVAVTHALDMYETGTLAHRSATTGLLADRLMTAGVAGGLSAENLALGATPAGVHGALVGSSTHYATLVAAEYRRVGIGVVTGPYGLMTVQVFTD